MGQLSALVELRLRRLAHRRRAAGALGLLVPLAAGLLLAVGWVLSPDDLGPQRARSGVIHWGGWAVESAFYLGALLALVQSFRILEAFFRHPDARFLATYPVRLPTLFVYRLVAALLSTGGMGLGCALFLLPVGLKGAWAHYLAALVLLALAVLLVVSVGFAAQMAAGVADYRHLPSFMTELDERSGGPGGGTAAYLFSPAIALGVSLLLLLFAKLSLDEVFERYAQAGEWVIPGVARFAAIALLVVVVGGTLWAYRNFTRHFPGLFSRFFELDLVVMDVGYDYFARDRKPPTGLEARLPDELRTFYRLDRLQAARRSPLARFLAGGGALAAVLLFVVYGHRLTPWMVLGAGLAWVLVVANPWSRVFHPDMEPGMGHILPVRWAVRRRARGIFLAREALLLSLPFGLAGLTLGQMDKISAALAVVAIVMAALPLLSRAAEQSPQAPRLLGVFVATAGAGLTVLGAVGPWLAVAGLGAVSLGVTRTENRALKGAA